MPPELDPLVAFLVAHRWWAATAVAVGLLVRLLKANPQLAEKIPARWRPTLVLALGIVSAMIESIANGENLAVAIAKGVAASGIAALGHGVFIEGARAGREIGDKKEPPPPDDPSQPVLVSGLSLVAMLIVGACGLLTACASWGQTTCAVIDVAEAACAKLRYMGADGRVHEVAVKPAELRAFGDEVSARRAGEARAGDGGAP